jgi:hypothetical protein
MWRVFAFGGVCAHAAAGTWPVVAAISQGQPVSWAVVALHALAPGLIGSVLTVLGTLAGTPSPLPVEARFGNRG